MADVVVQVQNSRFQNPEGSLDVNADGLVTPIDALLIINYLNSDGDPFLPNSGITPPPYLDTNGDEQATPTDVLLVINFLNDNSSGGGTDGEGEADPFATAYVMTVTPEQVIETVGPQVVREIQAAMDSALTSTLSGDGAGAVYGPVLPRLGELSEGEENEEIVDMLGEAQVDSGQVHHAIDEFFGDFIGPRRPS